MRIRVSTWFVVCVLVGASLPPLPAQADPPLSELEEKMIESADTPKEHARLAEFFVKKAIQLREDAAFHRRMGRSYESQTSTIRRLELKVHCDELATLDEAMAKQYDEMAALHRAEATGHKAQFTR